MHFMELAFIEIDEAEQILERIAKQDFGDNAGEVSVSINRSL